MLFAASDGINVGGILLFLGLAMLGIKKAGHWGKAMWDKFDKDGSAHSTAHGAAKEGIDALKAKLLKRLK